MYRKRAAAIMAAALTLSGCDNVGDEADAAGASTLAAIPVETRWLIPPDPNQEPPFSAPLAMAVDEERGRLLILEAQPPELRVYTVDGHLDVTLGREGGGPGEYTHPFDVAVNKRGVAAVLSMTGRVTYWSPEEQLLGTAEAGGAGMATDIMAALGDTFYVKVELFPPDDVAEFRVVTLDSVLPEPRFSDEGVTGTERPGQIDRNHSYAVAASPEGGLLLSPPGPDYLILRFAPEGHSQQPIRRTEIGPLERSPEEIETIEERIRKRFAELGAEIPPDFEVSGSRSHIRRLAIAPDSTIWAHTLRGADSASIIDVFDKLGTFRASYRLDILASRIAVGSERLYALAAGDLGVVGVAVAERPDRGPQNR
jgi:hypothetical protein